MEKSVYERKCPRCGEEKYLQIRTFAVSMGLKNGEKEIDCKTCGNIFRFCGLLKSTQLPDIDRIKN